MTNYTTVLSEIRKVSGDVSVVAVSKTKPWDMVMEAYAEGARIFGENRVQEIEAKFPSPMERPEGMKVYLIGHLQSNKVRKVVPLVDRIESVDSLPLLLSIAREAERCGKRMDVLLEVNASGEERKSGFRSKSEAVEAARVAMTLPSIILRGVMTVGPLGGDEERNREAFRLARSVYEEIREFSPVDVLSMGMSGDWKEAVEEGSTEVRIGSSIFGGRN